MLTVSFRFPLPVDELQFVPVQRHVGVVISDGRVSDTTAPVTGVVSRLLTTTV